MFGICLQKKKGNQMEIVGKRRSTIIKPLYYGHQGVQAKCPIIACIKKMSPYM